MTFDPQSIAQFFDQYGQREWERLVATPAAEISLYIHLKGQSFAQAERVGMVGFCFGGGVT